MKFIRTKVKKEKPVVKAKRPKIAYIVLICLALTFKIFITVHTSASGAELVKIEQEEKSIVEANQDMKVRLVENTSLMNFGEMAEGSKFQQPDQIVYLKSQDSLAKAP